MGSPRQATLSASPSRPPVGGTYTVTVTGETPSQQTFTDSVTLRVFDDITDNQFIDEIVWLAESGITVGCSQEPLRYCPDRSVTRAQMASFLARALDLETPPQLAGFDDVDPSGGHAVDIEALFAAGITVGCSQRPLSYCPDRPVTRGPNGRIPVQGSRTHHSEFKRLKRPKLPLTWRWCLPGVRLRGVPSPRVAHPQWHRKAEDIAPGSATALLRAGANQRRRQRTRHPVRCRRRASPSHHLQ